MTRLEGMPGWRRVVTLALGASILASGCTFIGQSSPAPSASVPPSPTATATPTQTPVSQPPATAVPPTQAPTEVPATEVPATESPTIEPTATPRRTSSPKPSAFKASKVKLSLEPFVDVGADAQPVYLTGDGTGEGRLYLVQRAGLIRILNAKGKVTGTLLDLRGRVGTDGERGLHAVALHPKFAKNGKFYVNYNTPAGNTRIVEYRQRKPGQEVGAGSGTVLMDFSRPEWNHNGGWLGFGPDGYLYIASGDGGGNAPGDPFGNGQDRSDLFGSILRIDVDKGSPYAIPKDNPFRKGGGRKELWNYGLRNPWRASFDRLTGDLWIGDVGQSDTEEIDIQKEGKGGLNFGWSIMEGSDCHRKANCSTKGLTMPVTEYAHGAKGCSVTGGYVYRGTESPALYGAYLFTDYCSGIIWGIDASKAKAGAKLQPKKLLRKKGSAFVSFGEDDDGELYLVSIGGGVYHIVGREKA
ncbi:MAG: PQQ-dependent sugar dehydrogenase [Chloroflexota bacterium]